MKPTRYYIDGNKRRHKCVIRKVWKGERSKIDFAEVEHVANGDIANVERSGLFEIEDTHQQRVYQAALERGDTAGWSREQFAARQVARLQIALGEIAEHFSLPGTDMDDDVLRAAESARSDITEGWLWENAGIMPRIQTVQLASALAKMQIVLFCMSERLGIDVIQAALDKLEAEE